MGGGAQSICALVWPERGSQRTPELVAMQQCSSRGSRSTDRRGKQPCRSQSPCPSITSLSKQILRFRPQGKRQQAQAGSGVAPIPDEVVSTKNSKQTNARLPQVGIGSRVNTAQIVICEAQPVRSGSPVRRGDVRNSHSHEWPDQSIAGRCCGLNKENSWICKNSRLTPCMRVRLP